MKRRAYPLLVCLAILISPAVYASGTAQAPPDDKAFQEYVDKMREHMKTILEQKQKIQQAADPMERQRLMQEHWTAMQEFRKLMNGSESMPGCMSMGGGPMMVNRKGTTGSGCCDGNSAEGHRMKGWWHNQNLSKEEMNQRMQMMGACMGMHQQMLDQMTIHQSAVPADDAKKP